MNITPILNFKNINFNHNKTSIPFGTQKSSQVGVLSSKINFRGSSSLENDIFEKFFKEFPVSTAKVYGEKEEKILDAEIIEVPLKRDKSLPPVRKYSLRVDDKEIGSCFFNAYPNGKYIYIQDLKTQEHAFREYRGAGTALIKEVIKESKRQGYDGKVHLCCYHDPSPCAFYYKNNFVAVNKHDSLNVVFDYIARNNLGADKFPITNLGIPMEIDPKSADKLLKGDRIYEDLESTEISRKMILSDRCMVIGMPSRAFRDVGSVALLNFDDKNACAKIACHVCRSDNNKLMLYDFRKCEPSDDEMYYFLSAMEKEAKRLGYKGTIVIEDGRLNI
ncbi:MAG: GNAT family N-acetyltransferase [Cyanobacteria bacterium SIG30]|nr:GNAT family N-acetyltransferase [Cyanobacteria bacterium SIG30]